jgi:hypothetical protein
MNLKSTFVVLIALSVTALITSAFFNGPANRGHDKTGSPLSNGTCLDCHSNINFSPNLMVGLYDGETQVDKYDPGKEYTLRYELMNSGSPAGFGFQTVALNSNDESAGSFSDLPDGFRMIELNNATYVEHESPRPVNSFEVKWTAPQEGGETITVYTGSVAINGNSSPSGDGADTNELILEPNTSGLIADKDFSEDSFSLKSNLVTNTLDLDFSESNPVGKLSIIDNYGRLWMSESIRGIMGDYYEVPVASLAPGFYFIRYENEGKGSTLRFYKD